MKRESGKTNIRKLSLAFGLLLLAGQTSQAGQTPAGTTNLWTFAYARPHSTYLYNSSTATPAVAPDGTIYQGTFDGTFLALTPAGAVKWKFKAGREIHSSSAIADDDTIYFGSRDRSFYALTPDGKLKWAFATGGWVDSSPAIAADGTVYFGSWDKSFYALNPDGSLKWKFTTGAIVDSSPAIAADGTIYFGSHDKKFYALHPDGRVRWEFPTGGGIISSPAIGPDGITYFSSLDGNFYAVDPDGTERWHRRTDGTVDTSPAVDEQGRIYLALRERTICFTSDGRTNWSWQSKFSPPAVVPGQVYISHTWLTLDAVDRASDWQWIWSAQMNDYVASAPVIAANGTVYISSREHLYSFQPPVPLPPATSSWPMFRANARHTGRVAGGEAK